MGTARKAIAAVAALGALALGGAGIAGAATSDSADNAAAQTQTQSDCSNGPRTAPTALTGRARIGFGSGKGPRARTRRCSSAENVNCSSRGSGPRVGSAPPMRRTSLRVPYRVH